MAPQAKPKDTEPLPKTAYEIIGFSIREFGFAAVLAVFVFVQWQADQERTARIENILVSNAEVLRTNSLVMERLGTQWQTHETTAKEFIKDITDDIDVIKNQTSKNP